MEQILPILAPGSRPSQRITTGLRAAVLTDKEISQASVGVSILREATPTTTAGDFRAGLVEQIGAIVMNLNQSVSRGRKPMSMTQTEDRYFQVIGTPKTK